MSLRNLFIFITLIVLAISIIAIYIVVDRTISIPLTRLKDGAIEIGKGNLDFMITPSSTIDEIGELSSQFGKMRARIKARTEELMRRDKELETANEELKSLDRLKDEFINIAAHELRTPIQPILSVTEVIRSEIKDPQQQELLDITIRNAKRLKRLAEDILDITRIESQSLKLNKERFNLNELISNVVQDHRNHIEKDNDYDDNKNNISLLYESKNDIFFVEADRYRLTQVVSNLLDNAIKFTKEGGTVSVTLDKKKQEEDNQQEVLISIKDSGTGIHSDILPRLFSKFASKSEKGTGLGLFISKNIVEAHGGRIWAENNIVGKGATFYFSLPLSK
jgi:signal transduction histidine kinase